MGCHVLLQGIFLTQGLYPGLLHCRPTLSRLSHNVQGSDSQLVSLYSMDSYYIMLAKFPVVFNISLYFILY